MNRKQVLILLILVVVVGGAGWYFYHQNQSSWQPTTQSMGKKLLGEFPMNEVSHIDIKQGTNEVNLVKKDGLWRVRERYDYPANYSDISDFLIKAGDLKIVQSEPVGPSQLPRLWLAAGQGTNAALLVDFKDQSDKTLKSLLLGKKHMKKSNNPSMGEMGGEEGWPDGRWVKVGSSDNNVALISDALANIEPKPENWLNKDFFKVDKIKTIAVTYPVATNSFHVSRDTETASDWKLADSKPGEELDSSKTSGFSYALSSPAFNDVMPGDTKPEQLGLDKPTVVTLDTFDNFTYTLKVGAKTNDNYPLAVAVSAQLPKERTPGKDEKPADKTRLDKEFKDNQKKLEDKLAQEKNCEKWVYLVSTWTLDPVLKERSQLMAEPKKEAGNTNSVAPKIESTTSSESSSTNSAAGTNSVSPGATVNVPSTNAPPQ